MKMGSGKLPAHLGYVAHLAVMAIWLSGCEATLTKEQQARCAAPDNVNAVRGHDLCLGIMTYGSASAEPAAVNLIVWLHGDVLDGGPADEMYFYARYYSNYYLKDTWSVAMLRPGYQDRHGKRSTGSKNIAGRYADSYTAENVDAVADAIRRLRQHHKATRVVAVGHSGGATIAALVLGRHPEVLDSAILVSCACNQSAWRASRGFSGGTPSLDPMSYVDGVSANARVFALTGTDDANTHVGHAKTFIDALSRRQVHARFEAVAGADHGLYRIGNSPQFRRTLNEALGIRGG